MEKIKVLFICHGNICRSTMAQYIAQHLVTQSGMESNFYIDSAATSREEIGNPVHYGTRRKLEAEGIFCGDHRARQLKKSDYDEFDFFNWNGYTEYPEYVPDFRRGSGAESVQVARFYRTERRYCRPMVHRQFDLTYRDVLDGCRGASEIYRRTGECLTKKNILCNTIVAEENYSSSATMSSNTLIKSWIFWIRTFLSKIVFFRFTDKDSNFSRISGAI